MQHPTVLLFDEQPYNITKTYTAALKKQQSLYRVHAYHLRA